MPTDVVLVATTAVLTAVAVCAAVVAIVAARRADQPSQQPPAPVPAPGPREPVARPRGTLEVLVDPTSRGTRVVAPPTQRQVVNTALGRPQVRAAVALRGLAYALRPESRDRIVAMMRREYRRRRAERLRAGRRAVRAARPVPADAWTQQDWIGELETSDTVGARREAGS